MIEIGFILIQYIKPNTISKMKIIELPITATICVFGHQINGLAALKAACSKSHYLDSCLGGVDKHDPKTPIAGLYFAELWHPYPRFDSDDWSDNRVYSNFLISDKPISNADILAFAKAPGKYNYNLVTEDMNPRFAPAVYYVGDGGKMLLATDE